METCSICSGMSMASTAIRLITRQFGHGQAAVPTCSIMRRAVVSSILRLTSLSLNDGTQGQAAVFAASDRALFASWEYFIKLQGGIVIHMNLLIKTNARGRYRNSICRMLPAGTIVYKLKLRGQNVLPRTSICMD